MSDYNYLPVSDGSGDAALMHVSLDRSIGATTLNVDVVTKVPANFIATSGTLLPSGFIDPATKTDFKGHLSGGAIVIDSFEAGSSDLGNTLGQVVIIKPNTGWANRVATFIKNATGFGTPEAVTFGAVTATEVSTAARTLSTLVPSGVVLPFAGSAVPADYLLCQGQAVSRSTYAALFSAIGTNYGVGDGSITFNVPDLRTRVPAGYKSGDATFGVLGQQQGAATHFHWQTFGSDFSTSFGEIDGAGSGHTSITNLDRADWANVHSLVGSARRDGTYDSSSLQPTLTMNYIIKI